MNVFDIVNQIYYGKEDIFTEPQTEKEYSSYVINKALSFGADTILYANEMNLHHGLDKKLQYEFLKNAIPKRKRFNKWIKKGADPKHLDLVCSYYKYSKERGMEALSILSEEQIKQIEQLMDTGGKR